MVSRDDLIGKLEKRYNMEENKPVEKKIELPHS